MSIVAARLSKNGTLYTNKDAGIEFDEITQTSLSISISDTTFYTGEMDEVSGTESGRAMQQIKTGVLKISGVFDEVTGIS
jgi:hypothetical protein